MPGHEPEACTKTVSHEGVEARVDAVLDEDYNGGYSYHPILKAEGFQVFKISW